MQNKNSYGVACVRFNKAINKYEILLVEKRCTYCFILFVCGVYRHRDGSSQLKTFFNHMTREEKKIILSMDFDNLYYHAFLRRLNNIEDIGDRIKYQTMCSRYKKLTRKTLLDLMHDTKCITRIWEYPKGRKEESENDLNCAMREFEEETGIGPRAYEMIDKNPYHIKFTDLNCQYTYVLYIAMYAEEHSSNMDFPFQTMEAQNTEVSNIRWVSSDVFKYFVSPELSHSFKNIISIVKKCKKKTTAINCV